MKPELRDEIMRLTPIERLDLIGEIWQSLEARDIPPLTAENIESLEQELAGHIADPTTSLPWEDVRARLWSRHR